MSYFSDLGLAEPLLRALETKGYSDPTPIQRRRSRRCWKAAICWGIAQTGTGKTAAFSLPSLHRLAANPRRAARFVPHAGAERRRANWPPRSPRTCAAMPSTSTFRSSACSAACPSASRPARWSPGCDVLVATPGRLLDLIDQRALTLRNVEIFVLDEADQMMDLGFIVP
jgi:ATP-dependent RNA helicase RhlE